MRQCFLLCRVPATVRDHSLQIVLWAVWTIAVGSTAFWTWHSAAIDRHAFSTIAMLLHCSLAGVFGLIVLTLVEMHAEPERFLE